MSVSLVPPRMARRTLLAGAGLLAAGLPDRRAAAAGHQGQAGIADSPLPFIALGGFDLRTVKPSETERLLRTWTGSVERLQIAGTTMTVGFGPSMFEGIPGLLDRRPPALRVLPAFPGEAIDDAASHGDLCVQVCASSPAAAADGLRSLVNEGRSWARLRWRQIGYRAEDGTADPRNAFGFRDGTVNPARPEDLWVSGGPEWLHGGTYLVMRRIRMLLDTWDRVPLGDQESMIGRRKTGNARIQPVERHSHVGLAAGAAILRRSYTYDGGVDVNGLQDSGLIFLSFQRDPGRQFVPVQKRLAQHDRLNGFSQHTATGVYACPARPGSGSWIGAELLA